MPETGGVSDPGVILVGGLSLPLTSCGTPESGLCPSEGQHNRDGPNDAGVDTGAVAEGIKAELVLCLAHCCRR